MPSPMCFIGSVMNVTIVTEMALKKMVRARSEIIVKTNMPITAEDKKMYMKGLK